MNADEILQKIYEYLATYGLKIIAAVAILIIGRWLTKLLSKLVRKGLVRADMDKTLVRFGESLCYMALLTFVVIAALATVGIYTTSFVAVVAAAGCSYQKRSCSTR